MGKVLGKKEQPEFDRAEEYIKNGITMFDAMKSKPYLSRGYQDLGDLYNNMGRKEEASKYPKMAEGMFKEMEMDYDMNKTQEVLARL